MPADSDPAPVAEYDFDPATLRPITDGRPYLGTYETGLYPGGVNEMPPAHRQAGQRLAAGIRPLDGEGRPDERDGRVLALVLGHSNTRMYFGALRRFLGTPHPEPDQHAPRPGYMAQFEQLWQETAARLERLGYRSPQARLNPRFELLNAAVGGQQLPQLVQLTGPVWDRARELTTAPGYSPRRVRVLFLHTTYHGASNRDRRPPPPFPEAMRQMQRDLATVLAHCVRLYPHLDLAYLTCDGLRHFTGFEPHVWLEGFAVKWLIEGQIQGQPGTAYEGQGRRLPWLAWGPYIWDNTWDARHFTDGVHPGPKALTAFVQKYWDHLSRDSVARSWLLAASLGGGHRSTGRDSATER